MSIIDYYNQTLDFVCSFLAVNCSSSDSQVLLSCSALKDFKISICNENDNFEFEQNLHITVVFLVQFTQEMILLVKIFEIKTAFRLCDDDDDNDKDFKFNISDNLHYVPEQLC